MDGDVTNASVVLVDIMATTRRIEERVKTLLIIVDDVIGIFADVLDRFTSSIAFGFDMLYSSLER